MAVELDNLHHMPTIKVAMTPFPFFVDIDASIEEARAIMRENEIHHLPVTEDGALVGVLSARDVRLLELSRRSQGGGLGTVRDACVRDVYVVDVDTPLDEVLLALAEAHGGAALVVMKSHAKLAGILTTSDVCRLLADLLRQRFPTPPEGDAAA
jgi:acetoin utilization protein AcuB